MTPPDFDRTYALFLDLDGTLLEIAATPDEVVVVPHLGGLLSALDDVLGGAIAIVSGRPLSGIDQLLGPFRGSAAGEHGAVIRYGDGSIEGAPKDHVVPLLWRASLAAAADILPGVIVETKPHGVTVHYRLAPELGANVWRLTRALVPGDHPTFRLLPALEAVEIGLSAASKGDAVERLMKQPAFRGRRPVFVGDDVTDEAGMRAARDLGGVGLRVSEAFAGDPAEVRAWLVRGLERMGGRLPEQATSRVMPPPTSRAPS
jgi:trehalose 6-phosphate phosphatase